MDWVDIWAGKNKAKPSKFKQNIIPPENNFQSNYIVEAADLRIAIHDSPTDRQSMYNSSNNHRRRRPITYSLAKIIDKEGPRLRLRHLGTDDRNDVWIMVDSDFIRPYPSGHELSVPFGFMNSHSVWSKLLSKVDSEESIAPASWFPSNPKDPGSNLFQVGEKLEAVDRRNAQLICPATIGEVKNNFVLVKFDGWSGNFDYWTVYNSQDLFPVGWCKKAGYKLQYPGPGYDLELKDVNNNNDQTNCLDNESDNNLSNLTFSKKSKSDLKRKSIKRKQSLVYKRVGRSTVKAKLRASVGSKLEKTVSRRIGSPDSEDTHHCDKDEDDEADVENNNKLPYIKEDSCSQILQSRNSPNQRDLLKLQQFERQWNNMKQSSTVNSTNTNVNTSATIKKPLKTPQQNYLLKASLQSGSEGEYSDEDNNHNNENKSIKLRTSSKQSIDNANYSSYLDTCDSISCDTSSHHEITAKKYFSDQMSQSNSEEIGESFDGNTSLTNLPSNRTIASTSLHETNVPQSPILSSSTSKQSTDAISFRSSTILSNNSINELYPDLPCDPSIWSIEEVRSYITRKNPNLEDIANMFKVHEIDGQALLLLTMNTLRQYMKIKLGPAIKVENLIKHLQQGKL